MSSSKQPTNLELGIKNTALKLFLFTGTWVASTALLSFGPRLWWDYETSTTLVVVTANLIAGALMLLAFFRHLKSMDELQRQTHLEAMALTLGITMIFTVIYGSLPKAQLLTESDPTNILFIMGITYILTVSGLWKGRTSE